MAFRKVRIEKDGRALRRSLRGEASTSTHRLCTEVDPNFVWDAEGDSDLAAAVSALNNGLLGSAPLQCVEGKALKQRELFRKIHEHAHSQFFASLTAAEQATINSEMLPGASSFLEAVPCKQRKLAWEPSEFVTQLQQRLLVPT